MLNLESELRHVPPSAHKSFLNAFADGLHNDFCLTIKSLTGTSGEFKESLIEDLEDYQQAARELIELNVLSHTQNNKMTLISGASVDGLVSLSKKKQL